MLVALYRQNPNAFVNNNMNRMKTGQILKVPTAEEVNAIERKDANQEIRTHVADWRAYREQLAGGVAAIPSRPTSDTGNIAAGRVGSAAVTPPAPPSAAPSTPGATAPSGASCNKQGWRRISAGAKQRKNTRRSTNV